MSFKQPNWKRTFEFIRRLVHLEHCSPGIVAKSSGVERETVDAWGRPVESDENPTATGKRTPFDLCLRLIGIAHKDDSGLAREIAETFPDYCDYLDELRGVSFAAQGGCINEILAQSAKEHADIIVSLLAAPDPDLQDVYREIKQAQAKINELAACCKSKMKAEVKADVFTAQSNGRR